MGMDGDPKARYANAVMTGYPSNEHVYSLPLRLGEYDAAQLIYALEDALGLVLSTPIRNYDDVFMPPPARVDDRVWRAAR